MTVNCKDCIWWGGDPSGEDVAGDHPGERVRHAFGETWAMRPCMNPKVGGGSYGDDEHDNADAAVSYQQIATGPMFGCVHGETA